MELGSKVVVAPGSPDPRALADATADLKPASLGVIHVKKGTTPAGSIENLLPRGRTFERKKAALFVLVRFFFSSCSNPEVD